MTRHRIAQIAKKVNPKSPENRHQTRRFLQNRLLHPPPSPPPAQRVGRSSRTTIEEYARVARQGATSTKEAGTHELTMLPGTVYARYGLPLDYPPSREYRP